MRLGIFGGSFDPVHYGHLLLAECAREGAQLDQVWFLPAAVPPHKQERQLATGKQRVEMLELAIGGYEPFRVSTLELDRGGVSYTYQTLEAIRELEPAAELFLILGADALNDLPGWRAPARICELALPLVVNRVDFAAPNFAALSGFVPPERLALIQNLQVTMPLVSFSSSDLRARLAAGQSIRYRTPRAVEKFIETSKLYVKT